MSADEPFSLTAHFNECRIHHSAAAGREAAAPGREHAALECSENPTIEIGRSRNILRRIVDIYVEDRYVPPAGPYIKADELHAIGRMNGLGNYVRTRDAFMTIPRISYEEWKNGKR
jgi:flavin reductase (DIM6/NTAB) family NADH-FMN oxidoreductase RutF